MQAKDLVVGQLFRIPEVCMENTYCVLKPHSSREIKNFLKIGEPSPAILILHIEEVRLGKVSALTEVELVEE